MPLLGTKNPDCIAGSIDLPALTALAVPASVTDTGKRSQTSTREPFS